MDCVLFINTISGLKLHGYMSSARPPSFILSDKLKTRLSSSDIHFFSQICVKVAHFVLKAVVLTFNVTFRRGFVQSVVRI